jgi:hypothetical protein
VPALYGIGADIRGYFTYLVKGQEQEKFSAPLDVAVGIEPAE